MADRRGSPLAQIEADLLNDRPLPSLLQKCILLGGRAGSEKMRDWARSELHGYPGLDGVPDYRHVQAPVMATITNLAGYNGIPTRIDPDAFSDQIRGIFRETVGDLEDAVVPFGIGRLEGLVSNGTDPHHLSTPFATVLADLLNRHFVQPGSRVSLVYWSVSNDAILGILSRIRTALAELVAELIALTPEDQNVPDKLAADQAVQFVITGDRPTIHYSTQHASDGGTNVAVSGGQSVQAGHDAVAAGQDATITAAHDQPPVKESWWTRLRKRGAVVAFATIIGAIAAVGGTAVGIAVWIGWTP